MREENERVEEKNVLTCSMLVNSTSEYLFSMHPFSVNVYTCLGESFHRHLPTFLSLSLSPSSFHSQNHLHNYLDFHWKVLPDFHKVKSWRAFSTRIKNLTPVNLIIAIKANNKSWKLHLKIEFIYWVGSDFWGELTFYCWPFSCQKRENFRISFNFV